MMAIMVIIIISMTPQAQWKEECHKLRWLKEQYLLLYYQVDTLIVDQGDDVIRPNTPNTVIRACIWLRQIWSSGVSLKRSCKMLRERLEKWKSKMAFAMKGGTWDQNMHQEKKSSLW